MTDTPKGYVKGSLVIWSAEIMAYMPEKWETLLENHFLQCLNHEGRPLAFNLGYISSVSEATDEQWVNWLTRLALTQENLRQQILDAAKNDKTQS